MSNTLKRRLSVAVIGSGAREHAIADSLARSRSNPIINCFASSNNPGIADLCKGSGGILTVGVITDPEAAAAFTAETKAALAVIGPEAPLAAGVADALRAHGISVFGPDADLAMIESSKSYARRLLHETIPESCPAFSSVSTLQEAGEVLQGLGENFVIKADGLTGGKGVKVSGEHLFSHEEALDYCRELLGSDENDISSHSCLIEEKLIGQEFSLMTITDGVTCVHLPAVQDHKRAFEGDRGPNTGGMGSYSNADHSLPFLSDDDIAQARRMNEAVVFALGEKHGKPYRGVLYGGFMAVADGVKIIEYNARFGDPESLNLLTLFDGDAVELFNAAATGSLAEVSAEFMHKASVCKYVVPEGYPVSALKGAEVDVKSVPETVKLFLGSVELTEDGRLITGGSRTAAVVALGDSIPEAEQLAETAVCSIKGKLVHRGDIGTKQFIGKRVYHMDMLRGKR